MNPGQSSRFPNLPVLEALRQDYGIGANYGDIMLVGVQHLNETTGSLICALIDLGFEPKNILLLGKNYSSNPNTIKKLKSIGCDVSSMSMNIDIGSFGIVNSQEITSLWEKVLNRLTKRKYSSILVIDDGGRFISSAPNSIYNGYKLASIEQTTKGVRNHFVINSSFPVISVASSRLKKEKESPIIAQGIIDSLERIDLKNKQIGIIGLGSIGNALRKYFFERGHKLSLFDHEQKSMNNCNDMETLISLSDIVFGCTGTQLNFDLNSLRKKSTILASCSSEDVEFKKVLDELKNPFESKNENSSPDLLYRLDDGLVTVLNSGYPINFRNDRELEPVKKIQLTRALIFGGVIQALEHFQFNTLAPGLNNLSEEIQIKIENHLQKYESINQLAV